MFHRLLTLVQTNIALKNFVKPHNTLFSEKCNPPKYVEKYNILISSS